LFQNYKKEFPEHIFLHALSFAQSPLLTQKADEKKRVARDRVTSENGVMRSLYVVNNVDPFR